LADAVNTVSPTYAREILKPSAPERGYFGGEGLEGDLIEAFRGGRLKGILNGCNYPQLRSKSVGWGRFLETIRAEVANWIAGRPALSSAHYLADQRLSKLPALRPDVLVTSVGRIAAQKTQLFREPAMGAASALERILSSVGHSGLFIMLGNGDRSYERFLSAVAATQENFLFLNGYSDVIAQKLYVEGDLFLMPSSFEPCGISQMLAMREGQLCVVHGVGGLCDTVTDSVTGFVFDGRSPPEQANRFASKVALALELRRASSSRWQQMRQAAADQRFSWESSAAGYEKELYDVERG
jgi:starch synthase